MRIRNLLIAAGLVAVLAVGLLAGRALEKMGNPDSPDMPGNTGSYTLEDIYKRLDTGELGTPSTFTEPTSGPGTPTGTMHALDEIMALIPDAGSDVTGPDSQITFSIPDGIYRGRAATAQDSELKAENIRDGETIFDVTGTYTCPERFTDNGDGTITDNQTKLMWAKNANHGLKTWVDADHYCKDYTLGGYIDWHLPDVWELFSLVDRRKDEPALPDGHPFENVPTTDVNWAQTWADDPSMEDRNAYAFIVGVYHPGVSTSYRLSTFTHYVWPVRSLP